MAELHLVDSSAWIFALRRSPREAIRGRLRELVEADAAATCGVVELELLSGAASLRELTQLERQLTGIHRLPTEEGDWNIAARLGFSLRRTGITVGSTDLLLAVMAIRHNAILVHADRHFDLIAAHSDLRVESLVEALEAGSSE